MKNIHLTLCLILVFSIGNGFAISKLEKSLSKYTTHLPKKLQNGESAALKTFSVEFSASMGKNDAYMHPYYKKFVRAIHGSKKHEYFKYIEPLSGKEFLRLCKKAYAQKKLSARKTTDARIPRVFHQIWVGGKPFPEKYKKWQQTWQSVPGWSYKLWTDEDVEKLDFPAKDRYYKETNMGARADILRIEILYRHGGVYIDTDFELLKPESFDTLNSSYDFYCGITPLDCDAVILANGLIGATPHHPIIKACRDYYADNTDVKDNFFNIINNGPGLLTKMFLLHANRNGRDIALPATYVYPLAIHQMKIAPYNTISSVQDKFDALKKDTCRPETIAIHWWEGSWY